MSTFLMIVKLLPAIIEAIKIIEGAIQRSGAGDEKRAAVLGIVTDTLEEGSKVAPAVASVIDRIVGLFNKTGVFQKAAGAS